MVSKIKEKIIRSGDVKSVTMFFVLIMMFILSMIASPYFRTMRNIMNLLNQNAIYGIMALGMCCCILTGVIDLSAGSVVALSAVLGAMGLCNLGFVPGVLIGLGTGTAIGVINGVLIAKFKVGYFITTLGMMSICRGSVYIITDGMPGVPQQYNIFGMGRVFGIPVCAIIWVICAIILGLIIKFTRIGQYLYAVGGNERATWLSGVNVDRVRIVAFAVNGFFCGMAGLILVCRVLMAPADAATGYEMTAIAACVVGGLSLLGGKGNVFNTIIGALIMGLILNILQLLGVSSYWQEALTGVVIIIAAGIDAFLNRSKD